MRVTGSISLVAELSSTSSARARRPRRSGAGCRRCRSPRTARAAARRGCLRARARSSAGRAARPRARSRRCWPRLGEPAVAEHDGLQRAVVGRHLARQHVAQQADALDVAALPAEVARGGAGHALVALLGAGGFIGLLIMKTVGVDALGHHVVARRHAARDLDVDQLVVHRLLAAPPARGSASHSVAVCGLAMRTLARLRARRAMCSSKRNSAGRRPAPPRRCRRRR
jgi:hypothetical protein